MSNTIKYSEGSESLALNKGNWWIGTGDSNKGPTVESGYWNAINPPDGGYTVYLNKESNGPSIHSIVDDEKLISFTNKISGQNYTTVAECLVYYQTQDDKICVNREYENIVTDGLVLNLDAGYVPSYPTSGTTWYDLSGNEYNGTLYNGPIYSGGSIVFDGSDDIVKTNATLDLNNKSFTLSSFYAFDDNSDTSYILGGGIAMRDKGLHFGLRSINGTTAIYTIDFFQNSINTGITVPNDGTFQHFCATYDYNTNTSKLYLNGVLQISASMQSAFQNDSFNLEIGSMNLSNSRNWYSKGNMGTATVYNRVLTSTEVLQNYNAQKHRFGL